MSDEHASVNEPADEGAFTLEVHERDGISIVALSGEIDLAAAPVVRDELTALTSAKRSSDSEQLVIVIDLSGVTFIDSTGLSMLVAAHARMVGEHSELRIAAAPPRVLRVLELTGLAGLLSTYESVDAALVGDQA